MPKQKITKKEKKIFWFGALLGIAGGIIGNILVSSAFTLITNSCQNWICYVGTTALMIVSFGIFVIMINKMTKSIIN